MSNRGQRRISACTQVEARCQVGLSVCNSEQTQHSRWYSFRRGCCWAVLATVPEEQTDSHRVLAVSVAAAREGVRGKSLRSWHRKETTRKSIGPLWNTGSFPSTWAYPPAHWVFLGALFSRKSYMTSCAIGAATASVLAWNNSFPISHFHSWC